MTVGPRRTATVAPAVVPALPLPPAQWQRRTEVVVVGSGAAGLMTALALHEAGVAVTIATKGALGDGSTAWAQGGLAAVLGDDDDAELHVRDTLVAGAGLCDEEAVRALVDEAPDAIASTAARARAATTESTVTSSRPSRSARRSFSGVDIFM